ncbi:Ubiquitin-like protein pmt3/smt3 [Vanrija pseudolonga]|uniref:Ubiquitin-like protein pmt3/smt3 n=1 Tax=Vanrija pseudolonga TaxID=143232 RepID=A0AAF0Y5G1_9TREE|nr:Ubiquitin-like protein pmt3/smt3 [Vanrija pseudolonga]
MSKGKGKEEDPVELSDTDSDTDFFTVKRRLAPIRVRAPSPEYISSDGNDDDDDDEEAEGAKKKKKKRRRLKPTPKPTLPEWTRREHSQQAQSRKSARAGTDDRSGRGASTQASDILSLVSSSDEESAPAGGARASKERRPRVKLTPPPEIDEETRAALARDLDATFQAPEEVLDSPEPQPTPATPKRPADSSPVVQVTVRMVADPDRYTDASINAIRGYERARIIQARRNETVSALIKVLADRVNKLPEEILVTYNGRRIFATSQTLLQLGIFESAEFSGYERATWDKLERQRKADQARLLGVESREDAADDNADNDGTPRRVTSGSPDTSGAGASKEAPAPPADETQRVRIIVRGAKGDEIRFATKVTTPASTILKYYCSKSGIAEIGLSLWWDGEAVEPTTTLEELDVENGDIVEVR